MIWHGAYGFENQIDSTYSPPHQGLFISGAMLATIPAASAWKRPGNAPSLREFLPAVLSVTVGRQRDALHHPPVSCRSTAAPWRPRPPFQDDLAGRADAYSGRPGPTPRAWPARSCNYGDDALAVLLLLAPT